MKRSVRKAIAFLLALVMTAGLFPQPAQAAEASQGVTELVAPKYDAAVTFSENVAFLENGDWSNGENENVSKDTNIIFVDTEGNKTTIQNKNKDGDTLFDAIYPMISSGFNGGSSAEWVYAFDALKVIKDGKISYIRADVDHPYFGDSLKYYHFARPISNDFIIVSDDMETCSVINVDGKTIKSGINGYEQARVVGECIYVQSNDTVYVLDFNGNAIRTYGGELCPNPSFEELENDHVMIEGGEYVVLLDEKGNIVDSYQVTEFENVEYIYTPYVKDGYVTLLKEYKVVNESNPNSFYYKYGYEIVNVKTGEIVQKLNWNSEFDGNVLLGGNTNNVPILASVDGTVYIENVDKCAKDFGTANGYSMDTISYCYYYVNESLLITMTDRENVDKADTFVLTKDNDFAVNSAKKVGGYITGISYDEQYMLTGNGNGDLRKMSTTKGTLIKDYGSNHNYKYAWAITKSFVYNEQSLRDSVKGFPFVVYVYDENGNHLGYALVKENGTIGTTYRYIEVQGGDHVLCYSSYDATGSAECLEHADYGTIETGPHHESMTFWNTDYFLKCSLMEGNVICNPKGEIVYGKDFEMDMCGYGSYRGEYAANSDDRYCKYNYSNALISNGLCVMNTWANNDIGYIYGLVTVPTKYEESTTKNGLHQAEDKNWYYYVDDKIDYSYNGVADNESGTWFVKNGKVDFNVNGLAQCGKNWYLFNGGKVNRITTVANNAFGWWYVSNGKVDFGYDGVGTNSSGTWYIENGQVDFGKTGVLQRGGAWYYFKGGQVQYINSVEKNSSGWWYIKNGKVDFSYDGVGKNASGTWYIENGKVDFGKTGVFQRGGAWYYFKGGQVQYINSVEKNSSGWWYIKNGKVDFSYDGVGKNSTGTWYIENGKVDFGKTGVLQRGGTWYYFKGGQVQFINSVEKNSSGWWYIKNGKVDFGFKGIGKNSSGSWYIKNGKVDFGYSGTYKFQGKTYKVVKGSATLIK